MKETILIEFAGELRDFAKTNACHITKDTNGNAQISYNFNYHDFISEHYKTQAEAFDRMQEINRLLERAKNDI